MISALKNAFKVKEIRKKILFVLGMMVVYRIGAHIPVPGIDVVKLREILFQGTAQGVFDYLDLFAGGALRNFTIFCHEYYPLYYCFNYFAVINRSYPQTGGITETGC